MEDFIIDSSVIEFSAKCKKVEFITDNCFRVHFDVPGYDFFGEGITIDVPEQGLEGFKPGASYRLCIVPCDEKYD